jgi:hypothetical protein
VIDTSFLTGQPITPLLSPFEIQAKRLAIANALAQQQGQQQALQSGALELEQRKQAIADQAATRAAMTGYYGGNALATNPAPAAGPSGNAMGPAGPDPVGMGDAYQSGGALPAAPAYAPTAAPAGNPAVAPPAASAPMARPQAPTMESLIRAGVPPQAAAGLIETFQKVDKGHAEIQKLQQETQDKQGELAGRVQEQGALAAQSIIQSGYNPQVMQYQLEHFSSLGPQYAAAAGDLVKQLQADPSNAPKLFQAMAAAGKGNRETVARETEVQNNVRKTDAELPGITADAKLKQLMAAGQAPIQPAEQKRLQLEAQSQAESRRHNRVEESNAAQTRENLKLTPQALDQMAELFHQTGDLPNLGMGAAVAQTRSNIINRTAELYPAGGVALNKAEYAANRKSLQNVTTTLDTLSAFESAGLKNLKSFTDLAAKLPDTGVPWLNAPLRTLSEKAIGSENMAVANAARDVALREIARVTNDPKLSGVLSDSARHEVQSLSPKDATLKQIIGVAKLMQTDMANVHESLSAQRNAISARISGPAAPAAAAAPGKSAAPPLAVQHMSTEDLLKALK